MKSCFFKLLIVAPLEEGKGYDVALYKRVEKYLLEHQILDVELNKVTRLPMWKSLGYKSTTNKDEAGVNWKGSLLGKTHSFQGVPAELTEAPVRVVPVDDDIGTEDHLFAWYRKDNGAAVAKARVTFLEK